MTQPNDIHVLVRITGSELAPRFALSVEATVEDFDEIIKKTQRVIAVSRVESPAGATEYLTGLLQARPSKKMPLSDAVESLVQEGYYAFERAVAAVDDAIYDGTLTINGAFEIGFPAIDPDLA
jgi:hypothetical protein